jgi:hypothetical protein
VASTAKKNASGKEKATPSKAPDRDESTDAPDRDAA